jgi:hypothetical protein
VPLSLMSMPTELICRLPVGRQNGTSSSRHLARAIDSQKRDRMDKTGWTRQDGQVLVISMCSSASPFWASLNGTL